MEKVAAEGGAEPIVAANGEQWPAVKPLEHGQLEIDASSPAEVVRGLTRYLLAQAGEVTEQTGSTSLPLTTIYIDGAPAYTAAPNALGGYTATELRLFH